MTDHPSTLTRPPEKLIRLFRADRVDADTIQTYLQKGFGLAICCKACPRMVEWTPPELQARFGDKLGLRIADLAPRLRCNPPEGCGEGAVSARYRALSPSDQQYLDLAPNRDLGCPCTPFVVSHYHSTLHVEECGHGTG